MSCINCGSDKIERKFISTVEDVEYKVCDECKNHYHNDVKNEYEIKYSENIIDVDGNKRNLKKERNFKLKNWYGFIPNYLNAKKNLSILDIGCGLGYLLSALNSSHMKFGIEDSQEAKNFIKENFKDINIIEKNLDELASMKNKFDIIILYHVLEHIENPKQLIKSINSILKKNGELILGTPIINSFISNYFGKNYRLYRKEHVNLYNTNSLKTLLENAHFKITKIEKPFFKTEYFTFNNIIKLFNPNKISPPFYGSILTLYSKKIN